jgi:uncharacterized protein
MGSAWQVNRGSGERRSLLFALEIALVAVIFWADAAGYIPLSKTPFLILVAWFSIRVRGLQWRDLGLRFGAGWQRLAGIGVLAGIAFWLFEYFVENPLLHKLTGKYPDLTDLKAVVGNIPVLLLLLGANIVLAGFGEELVWRGYALGRVSEVIGGPWRWGLALVLVNVAFGLAHGYQGEAGVTQAAVQGVLLGVLYMRTGFNLVAPIVAHIVANTCDFVLMFAGHHVGLTGRFPF